jgi:hypothetical protein
MKNSSDAIISDSLFDPIVSAPGGESVDQADGNIRWEEASVIYRCPPARRECPESHISAELPGMAVLLALVSGVAPIIFTWVW